MAVLIASAGWVLWSGFERSKQASQSVEHTYHVLIASERFLSTLREAESSLRAYVITHNRVYVASYHNALATQSRILDDLEQLTRDNPKQQAELKTIRSLAAQRLAVLTRAEQEVTAGRNPALSGAAVPQGVGTRLMSMLTEQVSDFEDEERRLLVLRNNASAEAVSWTRFMLILTSSLLALVLLFAGKAVERYIRNREAAHEALRRQADLIDFSHDAIVTLNPGGVITGWNAGAVELYGWSSVEALGRPAREILRTGDADAAVKIEESLGKTGRWDGELTQTARDGRICVVESRFVQVRNRAGAPIGVLNIGRDETQRKQAESLVRQAAEQRRLALDAAELGSWDYQVQQDSVTWDERCREIMGLPGLGPASFEQALKMVHPDERHTMKNAAFSAMSATGDGRFSHEMRIVLRDGSTRWLATHGRVYFDETNGVKRPVRVIGVNSDITESKRVEEALRESEDKVRVALETGRIGIFNDLVDENKIVFDARAKQLLGFAQEESLGVADFFAIVHPEDRERLRTVRSTDLKDGDGGPGELDYRVVHPNGDVRWLVARRRVYFIGEGERRRAVRVLGVLLDITEQKRAEQKLTEALEESDRERRRLGAILETMPAGVVLADRSNILVDGNAEAVKIWRAGNFARLAKSLDQQSGWRADSGEMLQPQDWARSRALHGETVLGEIVDIERFDGSRGTVFSSASPVRDSNGNIQGAVGVMVDITEQRQIELALRRSEESLEKLLEAEEYPVPGSATQGEEQSADCIESAFA